MDIEEHQGFDYSLDLDAGVVIHRDGFCARIVAMLDEDGDHTFDHEEVAYVFFAMPPEGTLIRFDLKDYLDDLEDPDNFEYEH